MAALFLALVLAVALPASVGNVLAQSSLGTVSSDLPVFFVPVNTTSPPSVTTPSPIPPIFSPPSAPAPTPAPAPVRPAAPPSLSGNHGGVEVRIQIAASGAANVFLPAHVLVRLIETAEEGVITLDISAHENVTSVNISASSVRRIVAAECSVSMVLKNGAVTFGPDALQELISNPRFNNINISITASGNRATVAILASNRVANNTIVELENTVTIWLPYSGDLPITAFFMDGGTATALPSVFDDASGNLGFDTNRLGTFRIGDE